ncbi:50S ribosomal protein L25 [Candidatus Parcubacteria bacterium]|nr:50S ribosomal protein L25 [Candidatus Parcubacteria bacterium]
MTYTLNVKEVTTDVDMTNSIKAVVYGPAYPSTALVINQKDFTKLYKEAGESSIISLKGLAHDQDVLIHDIQRNVRNGDIVHVDFYAVKKGQKITVNVPLVFVGVADAAKTHGADILKNIFEIEIEAEAKDLPHEIEVDISVLKEIDDNIKVFDIKAPKGVKILSNEDDVIITASKHEEEKEEESTEIDMSAIEVSDAKGKKDEEADAQ